MLNNLPGIYFIKRKIKSFKKNKYKWGGVIIQHRGSTADLGVIEQILIKKDYDLVRLNRYQDIFEFYEKCDNPLIVDAGANIGISTVWFGTQFPKATIVAIEPQSDNFSLLSLNTKNFNVNPIHGALSNRCGTIKVFDPGHGEWGFRTGQHEGGYVEEVSSYDIKTFIEPNLTPFILKIDIEGGEAEVFERNTDYFHDFPLIIIELHDWMLPKSGSGLSFLKWHSSHNRDFVYFNENVFSISNDFFGL
jgi:FkbM family methyltransferase